MSAPPFMQLPPPPLPPGWTEHISPTGHPYYFNPQTGESTYVRPLLSYRDLAPAQAPQKKKEKPLVKTPIPGTDWLRVKTTEGNVFYTNKAKKESLWVAPEEIREALAALEKEEAKAVDETAEEAESVTVQSQGGGKRKPEAPVPSNEVVPSKKKKVEEEEEEEEDDEGNKNGDEGSDESSEEEEEEDWQREAAIQLAKEAEEELQRVKEEQEREKERVIEEENLAKKAKELNMPARVDLSLDEAKALFKTLLREKDINPLHPWDKTLPLFISDPRYVLLPSVQVRREVFDEYCRERARELRESSVKKQKEVADPKEAFELLLQEEVTSTRASWTDFRRAWKKDRRFWGWGRDDREREKRFREFVKALGEKKRAAAQKAEADFFILLKESSLAKPDSVWKDVKKHIADDPRYELVASASLREELFNTFKTNMASETQSKVDEAMHGDEAPDAEEDEQERIRKRKEKAVREREEKVSAERSRVGAEIGRSRLALNKDEGEREFRTMLTDAIRDPRMTWDAALPQLRTDPRFAHSPLPVNQQVYLFHDHVSQLLSKHTNNLYQLFEAHTPSLATPFSSLPLPSLMTSLTVKKLGYDAEALEREYRKWQRERATQARKDFDQMLSENSFVEFWGRLSKMGGEGVDGGVKADDLGEDEGEAGGGKVDMKALAKAIHVDEMEKVLKSDKRYIVFDHAPEQREKWIRDYISGLAAPKLSVHVGQSLSA